MACRSPSIGQDGTIYIGTLARYLSDLRRFSSWFHAVNPDGSSKWRTEFTHHIVSSAAIDSDGSVLFGAVDGRFYRYSAEGVKLWEFRGDGAMTGSAVIATDGTIYVGGEANLPGCVNIWNGEHWRPLGDNLNGTVFDILPEGTNIFIAGGGNLWKIDDPVSSVAQWMANVG